MTVLVASTCAPYKCEKSEEALSWLAHVEAWREQGHEFFLAMEQIHSEVPGKTADIVRELGETVWKNDGKIWTFKIDTGERQLTTSGRLARICTGRNLAMEYLCNRGGNHEAVLFLDTDVEPPPDAIERLLEVDRQLVGFNVPTYCMDGPLVLCHDDHGGWFSGVIPNDYAENSHDNRPFPEGADVREHWNTAGALMVRREAARKLRWRWDLASGSTDDPCFQADAVAAGFGQTWVRHDVVGQHYPGMVYPLEQRGHDLSL